jgi:hypothetical protein
MSGPSQHATLSASGSNRWMNCPGSIREEKGRKDSGSAYAQEGTAAHEVASQCLADNKIPEQFLGQTIEGVKVDEEMTDAVKVYLDHIDAVREEMEGEKVRIEQKLVLSQVGEGMFGTADFLILNLKDRELHNMDYKHGAGVPVDIEWNTQMLYYAVGAVKGIEDKIDCVVLHIIQPRADHDDGTVRTWTITTKALLKWVEEKLKPAVEATRKDDAPLATGKWCKWCKAKAVCPEVQSAVLNSAQTDFAKPTLRDPAAMDLKDIGRVLEFATIIQDWAKAVQIEAQNRAEGGEAINGFKLVAKRANRAWQNVETAEAFLTKSLGAQAYTRKLLSPAQAEKACGHAGMRKGVLNGYVVKPEAGVTLVKNSDRRRPVASSAQLDFGKVPS